MLNTVDLVPALEPLTSRVRTDITWRKAGKRSVCERKSPLTRVRIKRHLRGLEQRGVCPIKEGENTTQVVCLDLDSHKGETSWDAMRFACGKVIKHFQEQGLHCNAFRSTGGKGMHIFFIWDTPQDAYSTRRYFKEHLATLGFKDGAKGVAKGEIEIFPKQDAVPMGGAGNQFYLPLSGLSLPLSELLDWDVMDSVEDALSMTWIACNPMPKMERPEIERPSVLQQYDGNLREVERMIEAIPNKELDYDKWLMIGMSLHAESEGSPDGLALWEKWSAQNAGYSGYTELKYKWDSFKDDKDKLVTIGSLKKLAASYGWHEDYSIDFQDVVDDAVASDQPEETPKGDIDPFDPIPVNKFLKRKKPKWLIKGILPEFSTGMTFGGSGDGKTFAVLDMACAIALGQKWNGRRVRQGHVVYICAEGAGGFISRLQAYCRSRDMNADLISKHLSVIPAAPNFMHKDEIKRLIGRINKYNEKTDLIIIDTMAQTTTGADENSAKDMNIAIKYLEGLRHHTKSAVHLIHHAGKNEDRGARGSTALKAPLDCQFRVSRDGDNRLFWVEKMKDGIDGYGWPFRLLPIDLGRDDEGDDTSSCVVQFENGEVSSRQRKSRPAKLDPSQVALLNAWDDLNVNTIAINDLIEHAMVNMPHAGTGPDPRPRQLSKAFNELVVNGDLHVDGGQVVNEALTTD